VRGPLPFRLLAITERSLGTSDLPRLAEQAGALLLRDKDLPRAARLKLGLQLRRATEQLGVPLLVHGDAKLATELGADGVHFSSRQSVVHAEKLLVGVSCHSRDELQRAVQQQADYALLSPVLRTPGKGATLGWSAFYDLVESSPIPVFALGGVGPQDLAEARRHGAWGVAGIRAFMKRPMGAG
jgi:8-oxo-dGTP diphosphatase